jgi:AAA domain
MTEAAEKLAWEFANEGGAWSCLHGPRNFATLLAQKTRNANRTGAIAVINDFARDQGFPPPINLEAYVDFLKTEKPVEQPAPAPIVLRSFFPYAPQDLKPRDWAIKNVLLRDHVTHFFGPGGVAKSLFTLNVALACALAEERLGMKPDRRIKVLVLNAEDTFDEMLLRFAAMGVDAERMKLLDGWIKTFDRADYFLVQLNEKGFPERTPFFQELLQLIKAEGIGLLILDPLVSMSRGLGENDAIMQEVASAYRDLARRCHIPVLSVHHFKKSGESGDQNAGRGSSTLAAAARVILTFTKMSKEQAAKLLSESERDDAWRYFQVVGAKSNYGPLGAPQWFKTTGVKLDCGEEVAIVEQADIGGNVEISIQETQWFGDFLDVIKKGRANGGRYVIQGPTDTMALTILTNNYGLAQADAKAAIESLLKAGVLANTEYMKADRHKGFGLEVKQRPEQGEGSTDDLPF